MRNYRAYSLILSIIFLGVLVTQIPTSAMEENDDETDLA